MTVDGRNKYIRLVPRETGTRYRRRDGGFDEPISLVIQNIHYLY